MGGIMGGGGGGGDVSITPRSPHAEAGTIKNFYGLQEGQYNDFVANNPLLNTATQGALTNYQGLPGLIQPISALEKQAPGFYSGILNQYGPIMNQLGGLTGPLKQTMSGLGSDFRNIFQPGIQNPYTPEVGRMGSQSARIAAAASGAAHGPGAIASEVLNRQNVVDQRRQMYTNLALGAAQGQGGLAATIGNILGQKAGVLGQKAGVFGQQAGVTSALSQGQQGLQTGGLNQLLGVGNAAVSQFSGLTGPVLGYLSNLFGGDLQSRIAGAQIGAQQDIAGQNKSGGITSGLIGAAGSVAIAL